MFTSPNMGLKIWNLVTDLYSHAQLEGNFSEIDAHDHTSGNGVQVPSGGIANGAVTGAKIATATITSTNIANATITGAQIAAGTITEANLAPGAGGLQPVSDSTTYNASAGQAVILSSGAAVTLPAPAANVTIGCICPSVLATMATINFPHNTYIGISGSYASSVSVGGPCSLVFISNGTGWFLQSGTIDTGPRPFVSLVTAGGFYDWSPGHGVSSGNVHSLFARQVGTRIHLGGTIADAAGGGTATGTVFTVPSWAVPYYQKQFISTKEDGSGAGFGLTMAGTNNGGTGDVALVGTFTHNSNSIGSLDALSYDLIA